MHRRTILLRGATALSAATLAGCSQQGDSGGPSNGGQSNPPPGTTDEPGTPEASDTASTTTEETTTTQGAASTANRVERDIESMCYLDNSIEELPIIACKSEVRDDQLVVRATIRNDGGQTMDLFGYSPGVSIYNTAEPTSESGIPSSAGIEIPDDDELQPSETLVVTMTVIPIDSNVSIEEIRSYTVDLSCNNPDSGVYC